MRRVEHGRYIAREGDDFHSIATLFYGDPKRAPKLLEANPGISHVSPGDVILVPNRPGYLIIVQEGESIQSILQRGSGGASQEGAMVNFFKWNGGEGISPEGGTEVFLPERRTNYGY